MTSLLYFSSFPIMNYIILKPKSQWNNIHHWWYKLRKTSPYIYYLISKRSLTSFLSFVKTPHKIITAKLSIRNLGSLSVLIINIREDFIKIKSFAVIHLHNFSTKLNWDCIRHANISTTNFIYCFAFTFKLEWRQTMQSMAPKWPLHTSLLNIKTQIPHLKGHSQSVKLKG